jgi:hypothetical protein
VTSHGGGATSEDGVYDLALNASQTMGALVPIAVLPENISQFQMRGSCPRRTRWCDGGHAELPPEVFGLWRSEQVQGASHGSQVFLGYMQIFHGGRQVGMPHEALNGGQINSRFQQVRSERMAQ